MTPRPSFLFDHERNQMTFILFRVCDVMGLRPDQVIETQRGSSLIINARHIAMYAFKKQMQSSSIAIACYFTRDHTTVLSALKRVESSPELLEMYEVIFQQLSIFVRKPERILPVENLSPKSAIVPISRATPF